MNREHLRVSRFVLATSIDQCLQRFFCHVMLHVGIPSRFLSSYSYRATIAVA
jgi:hypothetical protein